MRELSPYSFLTFLAQMRALCVPTRGKVERLRINSSEAHNLSAFRIGTLRACAE